MMLERLSETRPLLSHAAQMRLVRRYQAGDEKAKNRLVEHNMLLVAKWAAEYDRRRSTEHLGFEDLVQEGVFGLIRAIEKFDPDRGHRFSTYATWWIKQAMTRHIDDRDRLLRLPVHVADEGRRLYHLRLDLAASMGRDPSDEEMLDAAREKWGSKGEAAFARFGGNGLPPHVDSLDLPAQRNPEGEAAPTYKDYLKDETATDEEFLQGFDRERLEKALSKLSPRTRMVIEWRHGLDSDAVAMFASESGHGWERRHGLTLEECGKLLDVTRERIRQIQLVGERKLRLHLDPGANMPREKRLQALDWQLRLGPTAIADALDGSGLSDIEVGERGGCGFHAVRRARSRCPSTQVFVQICDGLGIDPESILGAESDPPEQPRLFAGAAGGRRTA